jgi:deoxyadenosine/deoxycytidine kinase
MKTWAYRSQMFFLVRRFRLHRQSQHERRTLVLETDQLDWMTDLVDRADLFRRVERHL